MVIIIGVALGFFLSAFVLSGVMLYYLKDVFFKRPLFELECVKRLARISPLFTGATMLTLLMHNVDRWLIGYFFTTVQVSYYFAATSVAALFIIPCQALRCRHQPFQLYWLLVRNYSAQVDIKPDHSIYGQGESSSHCGPIYAIARDKQDIQQNIGTGEN